MFAKQPAAPKRNRALRIEDLEVRQLMTVSPVGTAPITTVLAPPTGAYPAPYTPAEIRQAYGFDKVSQTGSGETIAIVVPYDVFNETINGKYDATNLNNDLAAFSTAYGLPQTTLTPFPELGLTPNPDPTGAWGHQAAMDVEWAHALAPGAKIDLFEANSLALLDVETTVAEASNTQGVSVVAMNFSLPEVADNVNHDTQFLAPAGHTPISYITGSGDSGANSVTFPSSSPNVLAVGGTTLTLNNASGYGSETAWNHSGGGFSQFEAQPSYQRGLVNSNFRATPDVSFDASSNSAVKIYHADEGGWTTGSGTELSMTAWSSLVAVADQARNQAGLPNLGHTVQDVYSLPASAFHDITTGSNGFPTSAGYDLVTGRGTPIVDQIVADLKTVEVPVSTVHVPIVTTPVSLALASPTTVGSTSSATSSVSTSTISLKTATPLDTSARPIGAVPNLGLAAILGSARTAKEVDALVDSLFDADLRVRP